MLNTFLKKCNFEVETTFYSNTVSNSVSYSYTTYMKHIYQICLLLASTREWLANRDTWKILTKIHLSKSIQVTGQTHPHTHILIYRDAPYYVCGVWKCLSYGIFSDFETAHRVLRLKSSPLMEWNALKNKLSCKISGF